MYYLIGTASPNAKQAIAVGVLMLHAIALSGCLSAPVRPEVTKPSVAPSEVVVTAPAPARDILKELLFAGLTALDNDHLTEPREGSAADYFGQVLDVDPDNAIALDGLQRLVARYVALAQQAYQQGAREVAEGYLVRAEPIARRANSVASINNLRQSWGRGPSERSVSRNEFLLEPVALDERGESIVWRLTEIAVKAMRANSRITIVSRNDAEGRWIYQQMREVLAEYRLRGNIVKGVTPKVILIDLPST